MNKCSLINAKLHDVSVCWILMARAEKIWPRTWRFFSNHMKNFKEQKLSYHRKDNLKLWIENSCPFMLLSLMLAFFNVSIGLKIRLKLFTLFKFEFSQWNSHPQLSHINSTNSSLAAIFEREREREFALVFPVKQFAFSEMIVDSYISSAINTPTIVEWKLASLKALAPCFSSVAFYHLMKRAFKKFIISRYFLFILFVNNLINFWHIGSKSLKWMSKKLSWSKFKKRKA